jgi:integrase
MPILLGALCGLRRGELAALRWRNIDLEAGQISVVASLEQTNSGVRLKPPKSGRARTVALPSLAIESLRGERLRYVQQRLPLSMQLAHKRDHFRHLLPS